MVKTVNYWSIINAAKFQQTLNMGGTEGQTQIMWHDDMLARLNSK